MDDAKAATSSVHAAAIGDAASTLKDAATSCAASSSAAALCERRCQDAAASSTRVVVQGDGSHRFTGYVGAVNLCAEFNAADGIYTASVDGMYYVSVVCLSVSGSRLATAYGGTYTCTCMATAALGASGFFYSISLALAPGPIRPWVQWTAEDAWASLGVRTTSNPPRTPAPPSAVR